MDGDRKKKKINSVSYHVRIREDLSTIIDEAMLKTHLSFRDIIEFSLIDFILKIQDHLIYEDIDLKEMAYFIKMEKLRIMARVERIEFLSGQLIIPRMRQDIFKLIMYHKQNPKLIDMIRGYINIRKKECMHYKDKDMILDYIKEFERLLEKSQIDRIKHKIEDELSNMEIKTIGGL